MTTTTTPTAQPKTADTAKWAKLKKKYKNGLPYGIDIGTHTIKIAQLDVIENELKITRLIMEDIPLDIVENPGVKKKELAEFFAKTFKTHNIKGEVFASITSDKVTIKNLVLPPMPVGEIRTAIEWELKEKAKAEFENLIFDYATLSPDKNDKADKIKLLVITTPKQNVLEPMAMLEGAGLKPLSIEPDCFSLLATFNHNKKIKTEEVVLLMDLGGAISTINVIRNQELEYTRAIKVNGHTIMNAIKDYFKLSFKDAEYTLKNFSLPAVGGQGEDSGKISQKDADQTIQIKNAISFQMEEIITDIEHTFKYYSFQLSKSQVTKYDRIVLCGGVSNLMVLLPFIRRRFDAPVEIDDPLAGIQVKKDADIKKDYLMFDSLRFSVAIGLALRAVES